MPIWPVGNNAVFIKTPQAIGTAARRIPWSRLSGTAGQIPARTRTIITSPAFNRLLRNLKK
jgi:hypothetical protein